MEFQWNQFCSMKQSINKNDTKRIFLSKNTILYSRSTSIFLLMIHSISLLLIDRLQPVTDAEQWNFNENHSTLLFRTTKNCLKIVLFAKTRKSYSRTSIEIIVFNRSIVIFWIKQKYKESMNNTGISTKIILIYLCCVLQMFTHKIAQKYIVKSKLLINKHQFCSKTNANQCPIILTYICIFIQWKSEQKSIEKEQKPFIFAFCSWYNSNFRKKW